MSDAEKPVAERPPRPAATVVVVRDGPAGLETLLLRRAERGDHNSGAWVFPGGIVDRGDAQARRYCSGLDEADANRCLGLEQGAIDFYIAAIRECFEEAGLLFATDRSDRLPTLAGEEGERLGAWRTPLHRGERHLAELCEQEGLRLAADRLVYLSHWLTPVGRPKRFDTRFFIAEAPAGQPSAHDAAELVEQRWLRPADAMAESGMLKLMTPTLKTLETIQRFGGVAELMAWARGPRRIEIVTPHVGTGREGPRPVLPNEPAWAELRRIDPMGHGHGCYDIVPGAAVRLSPRVIRISANNGSVMTGPGTNTYLVGGGPRNVWAAIDPGPADPKHVEAILAAAPGKIEWIFVTHTHLDHSPACALLHERTGAPVHGRIADHPEWQDAGFAPQVPLRGGERFALDGATLAVIHTPGHASNHLCYRLDEEKTLFTGDHLMQLSTVVINPPDGDMAAYLASLRSLLAEDLEWLAPGHGFLMHEPRKAIEHVIAHRLRREDKVHGVLRALGEARIEAILLQVYDDVPERMHAMALRSLRAHLVKLRDEGRAVEAEGRWRAA
jgi:glyoxylase-like metal-dependent hydrolase (beta-lactamase superfamily II)/8-oxo-dGTP pyrophosphatase MutT (NUDIX family)